MRVYLYILAGLTSALIGLSIGQFFVEDVGILNNSAEELIIFPCVAISLAVGLVLNEIFLSTPTRAKLNFRLAPVPLAIAAALGLVFGLIAGAIAQILFLPQLNIPAAFIRTIGWLCIGSSVGFAEGFTWRWRSIEAGNKRRFYQRLKTSVIAGTVAGLAAALLFELIRLVLGSGLGVTGIEDPIGFSILGILLGLAFSLTVSPSYMVALRAGAGFEYVDRSLIPDTGVPLPPAPRINNSLNFISSEIKEIEEGLSIQLPGAGKVQVGSASNADIYIPNIAEHAAQIELHARTATIQALDDEIVVNGERLGARQSTALKHNHILTFRVNQPPENNDEPLYRKGFYRFVYYNRFLDPQA
ncbi:MAG: hypothetical protein AAFY72_11370 [Cyanobacteria bacterium J06649_4]